MKARVEHSCAICSYTIIPKEIYYCIRNKSMGHWSYSKTNRNINYGKRSVCSKCWIGCVGRYEIDEITLHGYFRIWHRATTEQKQIIASAYPTAVAEFIFDNATNKI